MGVSPIVSKVLQIVSLICSIVVLVSAILAFFSWGGHFHVTAFFVILFMIFFALLLMLAELKSFEFMGYVSFLFTGTGKGLFAIFLGLVSLNPAYIELWILSIVLVCAGVLFIIVGCMGGGVAKPLLQKSGVSLKSDITWAD